jgi:hypothetical protein
MHIYLDIALGIFDDTVDGDCQYAIEYSIVFIDADHFVIENEKRMKKKKRMTVATNR